VRRNHAINRLPRGWPRASVAFASQTRSSAGIPDRPFLRGRASGNRNQAGEIKSEEDDHQEQAAGAGPGHRGIADVCRGEGKERQRRSPDQGGSEISSPSPHVWGEGARRAGEGSLTPPTGKESARRNREEWIGAATAAFQQSNRRLPLLPVAAFLYDSALSAPVFSLGLAARGLHSPPWEIRSPSPAGSVGAVGYTTGAFRSCGPHVLRSCPRPRRRARQEIRSPGRGRPV
jgi:hypothetical protein